MLRHLSRQDLGRLTFLHNHLGLPLAEVAPLLDRTPAELDMLLPAFGVERNETLGRLMGGQFQRALARSTHLFATLQPRESFERWAARCVARLQERAKRGELSGAQIDALMEADEKGYESLLNEEIVRAMSIPV